MSTKSITAVVNGIPTLASSTTVDVHVIYNEATHGYNGTDTNPLLLSALGIPLTATLLNQLICEKVAAAVNTWLSTSYTSLDVLLFSGCTAL